MTLLFVVALHFAGSYILGRSIGYGASKAPESERLVTVFIQPKIRDEPLPSGPNLARISYITTESPPVLHLDPPPVDFEVNRNGGAGMAAPTLKMDGHADMAPYVRAAALLPGEGVTVVLRVEVLQTGDPGRIEIDASSGSQQVDRAAVDYARTRHWYAGHMNGIAHTMWIRWGVRLQA